MIYNQLWIITWKIKRKKKHLSLKKWENSLQ